MNSLILARQLLPLLAIVLIFFFGHNEKSIARISFAITYAMGLSLLALLGLWANNAFAAYEFTWFMLYDNGTHQLPIVFYLDTIGAVYLVAIGIIFAIIVRYCRYYMHRESGYKRFFITIFAFAFGLNMVVLAGTIDTLFAGWEIIGVASFLLIAFYRDRIQPVRNALRAYTVYRFCDIGLLLGAWLIHVFLHDQYHFSQLATALAKDGTAHASYTALLLISCLIVIAASGKSAQFPFCFWLPRAMEGPTPSSAIFYGALSVHLGVFLLLRTLPIWSHYLITRAMILSIGLLTLLFASLAEKTQSNIKGQVAYASIAQVGIMFIELALGLESLVLIHFLGNAFLRCYQLLVSPSIVAHLLRIEGAIDSTAPVKTANTRLPFYLPVKLLEVLKNTLYVFALQEGNLELLVRSVLWSPLKRYGARINALSNKIKLSAAGVLILLSLLALFNTNPLVDLIVAALLALTMLCVSLSAFSQKRCFMQAWNAVGLSSVLAAATIGLLHPDAGHDILVFASGILPSWLLGIMVLHRLLNAQHTTLSPFVYRASAETHPLLALALFFSFLGLVGFPITPAFIGIDLLLSHSQHGWMASLIALCFVINGVSAARVFLRVCMGRPSEVLE